MPQPTFFFPVAFANPLAGPSWLAVAQEPQSTGDAPAGTPQTPGSAQVPGDPNAPKAAPQGPCADPTLLYMLPVMLLVMYLFVIKPDKKRRKQQADLLSAVKQGDHIVTAGGLHGTVARLTEKTVTLRVDSIEMTFDRTAVARVERGDGAPKAN